jgi:hypothetical protein
MNYERLKILTCKLVVAASGRRHIDHNINKLNSKCLFEGIISLVKVYNPKSHFNLRISYLFKDFKFLLQ